MLPRIWNHLPDSIKSIESLRLFKKKLKALLLEYTMMILCKRKIKQYNIICFMICMNFSHVNLMDCDMTYFKCATCKY
jgi:hypothetical protein